MTPKPEPTGAPSPRETAVPSRLMERPSLAKQRLIMLALAIAGILCIAGVFASASTDPTPDPATGLPVVSVTTTGERFSVTWVGDTYLGDKLEPMLASFGVEWVAEHLPPLEGDLVVANLEAPITERTEAWDPSQHYVHRMPPSAAVALADLGVDVVTLANNHAMDLGPLGLGDTKANLRKAGIQAIGAGNESVEARLPLLVRSDLGTLAIVNFADEGDSTKTATRGRPGVRRLTRDNLASAIDGARRAGATWVAAFVHWGRNYEPVSARQRQWAAAFAEVGYDLVVGAGPHFVQPVEIIGKTPIVYSVGNFILGTQGQFGAFGVPGHGLVVTSDFTAEGKLELSFRCILTDNMRVDFQPGVCPDGEAQAAISALHPAMVLDRDIGKLVVPLVQDTGER